MQRVLLALWCLLLPSVARAELSVILFEGRALRPGLCVALRIQLSDVGDVACVKGPLGKELGERLQEVSSEVRRRRARVGVMLARDPNPDLVRMFLVGARADEAVLAIERIRNRPNPDVDRSLALKVREVHASVEVVEKAQGSPRITGAIASPAPEPALPVTTSEPMPPPPRGPRVFVEAGAGLGLGKHVQGLMPFAIGVSLRRRALVIDSALGGHVASRTETNATFARVRVREWAQALSVRTLWQGSSMALGASFDVMLARLSARATSADGRDGDSSLWSPRVALGPDLRVRLRDQLSLRFAPRLELALSRERFVVDERVLEDLGRVRVLVPLGLHLELP